MTRRRVINHRTLMILLIVYLDAAVTEALSSAPMRVRLYGLFVVCPINFIGSWMLSQQDWSIEKRLQALAAFLVPATWIDLYVASKVIAKIEMHLLFYLTGLIGYSLMIAAIFGLVVAAERGYGYLRTRMG